MARVVFLLVLPDGFCQEEGTPICEGSNNAPVLEKKGAGLLSDSESRASALSS